MPNNQTQAATSLGACLASYRSDHLPARPAAMGLEPSSCHSHTSLSRRYNPSTNANLSPAMNSSPPPPPPPPPSVAAAAAGLHELPRASTSASITGHQVQVGRDGGLPRPTQDVYEYGSTYGYEQDMSMKSLAFLMVTVDET
jgi:hypothetical protein